MMIYKQSIFISFANEYTYIYKKIINKNFLFPNKKDYETNRYAFPY